MSRFEVFSGSKMAAVLEPKHSFLRSCLNLDSVEPSWLGKTFVHPLPPAAIFFRRYGGVHGRDVLRSHQGLRSALKNRKDAAGGPRRKMVTAGICPVQPAHRKFHIHLTQLLGAGLAVVPDSPMQPLDFFWGLCPACSGKTPPVPY